MKNFIFGVLLTISAVSWGAQWQRDGSLVLECEEVEYIRENYNSMRSSLEIAMAKLQQLTAENEALKTGKCI